MKSQSGQEHWEEHGAALFTLLFSLVIIGGLVHSLTTYSTHYGKLAATYKSGARVREVIRAGIDVGRSTRRGCVQSSLDGGDGTLRAVTTCTIGEPPFRFEPAIQSFSRRPDYAALFLAVTPCPTMPQPETRRSFTSPVSPDRCVVSVLRSSTIMSHNIEAESIDLQAQANVANIGTPGELTVTSMMTTDADLLIVAGGTIRIPSIRSSSEKNIRVTLVSAHGDIEVRAVSPNVSLLSIGRRLIAVPPSAVATGHPLPPMTSAGVSGVVL